MRDALRAMLVGTLFVGVLGAAGPAPDDTAAPPAAQTAPAEGPSAGQSFGRAWTDLKSSASNAWHGLTHGADAAAHGAKKGWEATKQKAAEPSSD